MDISGKGYVTFEDFKSVLEAKEQNSPSLDESNSSRISLTHDELR